MRTPGWGLFEYMRLQAEATWAGQEAVMLKLQAPVGISHVSTLSGRQIMVPCDRILEVTAEESKSLLGAGFQRI
jgi:hypothetical protein